MKSLDLIKLDLRRTIKHKTFEKYYCIIKEPSLVYVSHMSLISGSAKGIVASISLCLVEQELSQDYIGLVTCDDVNTQ